MPPLSRRAFLTTGGAATAAFVALKTAGVVSSAASAAQVLTKAPPRLGSPVAPFMQVAFTPQLNTTFRFHAGATPVDLQLIAVKELPKRAIKARAVKGEQFSLLFAGAPRALGKETYAVEHGILRHFSLFLVPVGPPGTSRGGSQEYQAIVNNVTL